LTEKTLIDDATDDAKNVGVVVASIASRSPEKRIRQSARCHGKRRDPVRGSQGLSVAALAGTTSSQSLLPHGGRSVGRSYDWFRNNATYYVEMKRMLAPAA
jgi:hypothetical protein